MGLTRTQITVHTKMDGAIHVEAWRVDVSPLAVHLALDEPPGKTMEEDGQPIWTITHTPTGMELLAACRDTDRDMVVTVARDIIAGLDPKVLREANTKKNAPIVYDAILAACHRRNLIEWAAADEGGKS